MNYETNPLNSDVIFSIGQPILLILIVFTAVSGLLAFIGRTGNLTSLDITANRWFGRFAAATLYTALGWLGLTMIISYVGNSVLDIINGAILLLGLVVSLVKRATSDQMGANRILAATYGFLAFILVWHFIFGAINGAIPAEAQDAANSFFKPHFFTDLFHYWHWG